MISYDGAMQAKRLVMNDVRNFHFSDGLTPMGVVDPLWRVVLDLWQHVESQEHQITDLEQQLEEQRIIACNWGNLVLKLQQEKQDAI